MDAKSINETSFQMIIPYWITANIFINLEYPQRMFFSEFLINQKQSSLNCPHSLKYLTLFPIISGVKYEKQDQVFLEHQITWPFPREGVQLLLF